MPRQCGKDQREFVIASIQFPGRGKKFLRKSRAFRWEKFSANDGRENRISFAANFLEKSST